MRLDHIALTVSDRECSAAFYAEYFGFTSAVHEDEHLLILADDAGSLLALSQGEPATGQPRTNHFGCRAADEAAVRKARERFRAAEVEEAEWQDDGMVRIQVFDPDGYRVEIYAY